MELSQGHNNALMYKYLSLKSSSYDPFLAGGGGGGGRGRARVSEFFQKESKSN